MFPLSKIKSSGEITLGYRKTPLAPCNDGEDNDSDGWTDESDPDCVLAEGEVPDAFYLKGKRLLRHRMQRWRRQ